MKGITIKKVEFKEIPVQPCFNCGSDEDVRLQSSYDAGAEIPKYYLVCHKCMSEGPRVHDEEDTIKLWNKLHFYGGKTKLTFAEVIYTTMMTKSQSMMRGEDTLWDDEEK